MHFISQVNILIIIILYKKLIINLHTYFKLLIDI